MMRGQALRYTGWMVLDRHLGRLAGCLVMSAAILLPVYLGTRDRGVPPEQAANLLTQMHTQFAFIFALLMGNGIVATDRVQGFFRFYLAKPVSPLWYYGQQTVLSLVFTLLASAGLIALFSLIIAPAWDFSLLLRAAELCLLMVLPIVMFSCLSRHDWLWAIVLWLLSVVLRGEYPAADSAFGKVLNVIMPPYQFLNKADPTAGEWLWMGAWGLIFFAGTMLILWRRPLAED